MFIIYQIKKEAAILMVIFLCFFSRTTAQNNVCNISVDFFGVQNTIGVNYDTRINGNSGLGYRIGVGYGYADNSGLLDQKINGIGIPIELNYLLGGKCSKLEFGFGTNLGLYHIKETTWNNYLPISPKEERDMEQHTTSNTQFGYFIFGNIGYRHQHKHGFMFRVGVTPSFNFGDKYGLKRAFFYPYIGFGKSF